MSTEATKLTAYSRIFAVFEDLERYNFRRLRPGEPASESNTTHDTRSHGWIIQFVGGGAFHVGPDKPPTNFVSGARIKHSFEVVADEVAAPEAQKSP